MLRLSRRQLDYGMLTRFSPAEQNVVEDRSPTLIQAHNLLVKDETMGQGPQDALKSLHPVLVLGQDANVESVSQPTKPVIFESMTAPVKVSNAFFVFPLA